MTRAELIALAEPPHDNKAVVIVQPSKELPPCGCRIGECESKADRLCRMTVEIAENHRINAEKEWLDEAMRLNDECIQCDRRYRSDPFRFPWNYVEEARAAMRAHLEKR